MTVCDLGQIISNTLIGEDPYESLPAGNNTGIHMLAGAAAGTFEHCFMYPADVIRTRMQLLVQPSQQNLSSTSKLFRQLYPGVSVVFVGAGPAHALYFAAYEYLKRQLMDIESVNKVLAYAVAGCGATLLHDAVMNPVDVIKQRMQVSNSQFTRPRDCASHIFKNEGFKAFYRSYLTQLTMNLPYQSLHFITYECMQDILNKNRDFKPLAHIISGGVAGGLAAACTTPLDVCKTLLNTQEKQALKSANMDKVTGLFNAARVVYRCRGPQGFFLGMPARILVSAPSTAIAWSVYEFFKHFMYKVYDKKS